MRKYTYILLIMLLGSTLAFAQKRAKTPIDLLQTIHKLAKAKKYNKLKKFLYQGKVTNAPKKEMKGKTMGDIILAGIKGVENTMIPYDAKGLATIIKEHSNRIAPISKELIEELFNESDDAFSQFANLKKIADERPNDLQVFDYSGVHILMAKIDKSFILVFWEGLDNILENNKKSTEPKKADGGR